MADKKTWWIVRGGVMLLVVRLIVIGALGLLASCDRESGAPDDDTVEDVAEVEGEREGQREGEGQREEEAEGAPTSTWTNDRSRLSGDKLTNFVPFTFEYPSHWQVLEDGTAESPNFVKIESMTTDRVTIENFAVGWYAGVSADQVAGILEPQFSQSFPNYRRLSDEAHQVDGLTSPGFTFQVAVDIPTGPTTFWGRTIAVPVSEDRGVIIVMFASEQAPGVESAADVGKTGNLEAILDSFDIQE